MERIDAALIISDALAAGEVIYHQNTPPLPGVFTYRGIRYRANATAHNLDALVAAIIDDKQKRANAPRH